MTCIFPLSLSACKWNCTADEVLVKCQRQLLERILSLATHERQQQQHHQQQQHYNKRVGRVLQDANADLYSVVILCLFASVILLLMIRAIKPSETLDDQVTMLLNSMRVRCEMDEVERRRARMKEAKRKVQHWLAEAKARSMRKLSFSVVHRSNSTLADRIGNDKLQLQCRQQTQEVSGNLSPNSAIGENRRKISASLAHFFGGGGSNRTSGAATTSISANTNNKKFCQRANSVMNLNTAGSCLGLSNIMMGRRTNSSFLLVAPPPEIVVTSSGLVGRDEWQAKHEEGGQIL